MEVTARIKPIEETLLKAGVEIEGLAALVAEALKTEEDLTRRRFIARTEAAFKEGFALGRRWPKFAPYKSDIWRKSDFYLRHFGARTMDPATEKRYAIYNE